MELPNRSFLSGVFIFETDCFGVSSLTGVFFPSLAVSGLNVLFFALSESELLLLLLLLCFLIGVGRFSGSFLGVTSESDDCKLFLLLLLTGLACLAGFRGVESGELDELDELDESDELDTNFLSGDIGFGVCSIDFLPGDSKFRGL